MRILISNPSPSNVSERGVHRLGKMYLFDRQPHGQFGTAENVHVRRRLRARVQYGADIQRHHVPFCGSKCIGLNGLAKSEIKMCLGHLPDPCPDVLNLCTCKIVSTVTFNYRRVFCTGYFRRLQLHGVCLRTDGMRQEFLDARRGFAVESTGYNTQSIRTRFRGHIRHGRREVFGSRVLHWNIQRRSERSFEFGPQTQTRVERESRKRSLRTRYGGVT